MNGQKLFVCSLLVCGFIQTASAISCYVCDASNSTASPFQCGEWFDRYDTPDLQAVDCRDVHDAKYCIKHVGRYEGGIGAKRYCSSKDLGNYCDYVQNRGDKMEYRSCIYTCSTDGCNNSSSLKAVVSLVSLCSIALKMII